MLLVDTAIWIDFFSGRNTAHVHFLENAIQERKNIFLCGVILTEILQGISDQKQYQQVLNRLNSLIILPIHRETFISAANIFRELRSKGLTVRKTIDCIIAAVAIENNIPLLHNDKDFDPIEKYCHLKTIQLH